MKKAAIIVPIVLVGGFTLLTLGGCAVVGTGLVLTAAGVAGTYYALSDNGTKELNIDENFSFGDMASRVIVDCLDYTTAQEQIKISVTEDDLNNIIYWGLKQANMQDNQYLTKVYCDINGNNYDFYADLNGVIIKSRVKIATTLGESEDGKSFIFSIKDVKVGKIGGLFRPAVAMFSSYIDQDQINEFFENAGLSLKLDKDQYALTYNKKDLMNDLQKFMKGTDTSTLFEIIDVLTTNDLVEFGYDTANFLDLNVNLNKLAYNDLVTDDSDHLKIRADEVTTICKNNILSLVEHKVINPDEANLDLLFSFLMKGYAAMTDSQKSELAGYDLSSIGIPVKETYIPQYASNFEIDPNETALFDTMQGRIMDLKSLISNDEEDNKEVTLLYETDLNNYIASRNISDGKMLLKRHDGENYKLNYIVVDNFYTNIYKSGTEQLAELVCKINLNGYHTSLTFESNATIENNEALTFHVKEGGVAYGAVHAPELEERFFKVLSDALQSNNENTQIEANAQNRTITIKFTGMIDKAKTSIHATLLQKAEDSMTDKYGAMAWGYVENSIDSAIGSALNSTFDSENAEVQIAGENRDVNGSLKLVLKTNNFKTAFANDVKDQLDSLDPSAKLLLAASGFNVDSYIESLIGA